MTRNKVDYNKALKIFEQEVEKMRKKEMDLCERRLVKGFTKLKKEYLKRIKK